MADTSLFTRLQRLFSTDVIIRNQGGNELNVMTEREKNEICKGYADLIINKTQLTRELWQTEIAIKRLENILIRNKILIPTETEDTSETDQAT